MTKKLWILLLLCVSTAYAHVDFTGTYRCHGFDPYLNTGYLGTVVIKQQNTVYSLKMTYNTGDRAIGTGGLYDDNTIAVVFQDVKNKDRIGLERYSFTNDPKKIQGYWVYLGKDKLGTEYCEKEDEKS